MRLTKQDLQISATDCCWVKGGRWVQTRYDYPPTMPFVGIIPYQNPSPLRSHRSPVYICIRLKGTGKTIWGWWGVDLFIFSLYVYHNHQEINETFSQFRSHGPDDFIRNLAVLQNTSLADAKYKPLLNSHYKYFERQWAIPDASKARNYLELGPVYCQCERNCIS